MGTLRYQSNLRFKENVPLYAPLLELLLVPLWFCPVNFNLYDESLQSLNVCITSSQSSSYFVALYIFKEAIARKLKLDFIFKDFI